MADYDEVQLLIGVVLGFGTLALVVYGLKTLMPLDVLIPVSGARRVHFKVHRQDVLDLKLFPEWVRSKVAAGRVLLIFGYDGCSCDAVIGSVASFSKAYPDHVFLICVAQPWEQVKAYESNQVSVVECPDLYDHIGLVAYPYVMLLDQGRVLEYAVVNYPEHVESVLEAA